MQSSRERTGLLCVMGSALIYGFTPILTALSYQGGNNGVNMAFLRSVLPLPVLLLLALRSRPRFHFSLRLLGRIAPIGVMLFGCSLLLYSSYALIPVGIATTLQFLYPLYVTLYEIVFCRRRMKSADAAGLVLSVVGVLFLLDGTNDALHPLGVVLALSAGLCFAGYIILLNREAGHPLPLFQLTLCISLSGVALTTVAGLLLGQLALRLTPAAWLYAAGSALLVTIGGCSLFQMGLRRIGEARAAMFSLLEPISNIFFGLLLLGEQLTFMKGIGCALIMLGLLLSIKGDG